MTEAKFTTKLRKWLKYNMIDNYGMEVKVVNLEKSTKFYYKTWIKKQPHQKRNLGICGRHFLYKFPDSAMYGTPFDLISLHNSPGWFTIMFYQRGVKHFYIIEISKIEKEIN